MSKHFMGIGIFLIGVMGGLSRTTCADTPCSNPRFQTQDILQHFNPPRDGSDRWLSAFEIARQKNNPHMAGYALVRYLLAQKNQIALTWQERTLLRNLRNILEHTESEHLYRNPRMLSAWLKEQGLALATVFNVDPLLRRHTIWGQPYPMAARKADIVEKVARDMLWSWAPFLLRVVPSGWTYWNLRSKNFSRWKDRIQSEAFWAQMPLKHDEFTQQAIQDTFPSAWHFRSRYHLSRHGTLVRPMIWGMLLMLLGIDPIQIATSTMIEPDYEFSELMEDLQDELGITIEGKNVAVIIDEDLIPKMQRWSGDSEPLDTNPMTGIVEVEALSSFVPVLQMMAPSSMEEFNFSLTLSRDADIIFIIAHGQPGNFVIGDEMLRDHLHQIHAQGFKEHVTLIFVSCNFGDIAPTRFPEEDQEPWVGLSRQILQNTHGKAIAAINTVFVHIKVRAVLKPPPDPQDIQEEQALKRRWFFANLTIVGMLNSMGLKHGIAYLFWKDYQERPFGNQKGFRMYDAKTGRISFFRSR